MRAIEVTKRGRNHAAMQRLGQSMETSEWDLLVCV